MPITKGPVSRYPLSDGGSVHFYRIGRQYCCLRIFPFPETPPEDFHGAKAEALAKVEGYLKKDVLDLELD